MHFLHGLRRVDDMHMLWIVEGNVRVALFNPFEELHFLLFKTVHIVQRQARLARCSPFDANLEWNSQKEHVIRLQVSDCGPDNALDRGQRKLPAESLVGDRRLKETVHQNNLALGQRRQDDLRDKLGTAGIHQ